MSNHMTRAKSATLFEAADRHATRVKLTERVVSEWQRELRLDVTGEMVGHPGAAHRRSVTIKKPAELSDLALKLKEFLSSPGIAKMPLTLRPHRRLVGSLWRDAESSIWDLKSSNGGRQGIRIDDALLVDLMHVCESYE